VEYNAYARILRRLGYAPQNDWFSRVKNGQQQLTDPQLVHGVLTYPNLRLFCDDAGHRRNEWRAEQTDQLDRDSVPAAARYPWSH
jgi:hypothetical protein